MNITQILQIADWGIINTGKSFIESELVPNQNKFVNLGSAIAHFNKNTCEVIAVVLNSDNTVLVYADEFIVDEVVNTYNLIASNSLVNRQLHVVSEDAIITALNILYNREPDSMLEIENMNGMTLAVIDDLADKAGLTRNGYMIKIICEQISAINPVLSA